MYSRSNENNRFVEPYSSVILWEKLRVKPLFLNLFTFQTIRRLSLGDGDKMDHPLAKRIGQQLLLEVALRHSFCLLLHLYEKIMVVLVAERHAQRKEHRLVRLEGMLDV